MNLNHKKLSEMRGVALRDNTFGRDTQYNDCGIITTAGVHADLSGNRYTDGQAVQPKRM